MRARSTAPELGALPQATPGRGHHGLGLGPKVFPAAHILDCDTKTPGDGRIVLWLVRASPGFGRCEPATRALP